MKPGSIIGWLVLALAAYWIYKNVLGGGASSVTTVSDPSGQTGVSYVPGGYPGPFPVTGFNVDAYSNRQWDNWRGRFGTPQGASASAIPYGPLAGGTYGGKQPRYGARNTNFRPIGPTRLALVQ